MPHSTHILIVDGVPHDDGVPLSWDAVLDLIWSGDHDCGAFQVVRMPGSEHVTMAALSAIGARTLEKGETPAHLADLLYYHRLGHWTPKPYRKRRPDLGFGTVFLP